MDFILTCPYNTAQIAKKELEILGYKPTIKTPTTLLFSGEEKTIASVNINSRIGNKLFLEVQKQTVTTFDDLYTVVSAIDWNKYISEKQPLLINAYSKNSILNSTPSIQSVAQKALIKKLLGNDERWDQDESLTPIEVVVFLDNNMCTITINTSGAGLHQRGYRQHAGSAPIKENLAAALVLVSGWKFSTPLIDPFCGAGTITIEAALIAKNIAPGLDRASVGRFSFQSRDRYDKSHTELCIQTAYDKIMTDKEHTIIGYDIDPTMIEISKDNAKNAGIEQYIEYKQADFLADTDEYTQLRGGIVTNPPYGERMKITNTLPLYTKLVELFENNKELRGGFITSFPEIPTLYERKLRKETLYYNGNIESIFYKIARL